MEPYGNIEPVGGSRAAISSAVGKIGQKAKGSGKGGGLLDALGAITGHRAMERMHQAQLTAEAEESQRRHETVLEGIDRIHRAGLSMDAHKAMLDREAREHAASIDAAARTHAASIAYGQAYAQRDIDNSRTAAETEGAVRRTRAQSEADLALATRQGLLKQDELRVGAKAAGKQSRKNIAAQSAAKLAEIKATAKAAKKGRADRATIAERIVSNPAVAPGALTYSDSDKGMSFSFNVNPKAPEVPAAAEAAPAPKKPTAKATKKPTTVKRTRATARPKLDEAAADAYND
jgi:hypothetical protein